MVRNYRKALGARNYANYTTETLDAPVQAVKDGKISARKASKVFGVPRGTTQNRIHGRGQNNTDSRTCPTALNEEEENVIVNHVLVTSGYGFSLTKFDIRCVVKAFLDKEKRKVTKFKENMPGEDWVSSFVKRHKVLTVRMAGNIKRLRAKVSPEVLDEYFQNLSNILEGIPPSNILNFDETNLCDDPGSKKIVTKRGCKYPERGINCTKSAHSVMFCISACGDMLPVYVVYKSEHMWRSWFDGGPPGARYNRTKSGWFDTACFENWFEFICLPYCKKLEGKKAVIGDNLSSHFTPRVIQLCHENDISIIALPANSTHLTQPCDIALFRPLKAEWRCILNEYGNRDVVKMLLSKDVFPRPVKKVIEKMHEKKSSIVSGFRKAGIYPLDKHQVLSRLPKNVLHEDDLNDSNFGNVSSALLEYLSKERYGDADKGKKKRRKKVNVEPGKSVCLEDFDENTENEVGAKQKPKKKKRETVVSESEGENDVFLMFLMLKMTSMMMKWKEKNMVMRLTPL